MSVDIRGADWSDRTVAQLRYLWIEGHTTAEIGRRLGLSKNAIIGKAHRLDLPGRKSPIKRGIELSGRSITRPPRVPKLGEVTGAEASTEPTVAPPQHLLMAAPPTTMGMLPQLSAERCCWPLGHPKTAGFRFCDHPVVAGKPYCAEHVRSAYKSSRDCNLPGRDTPRCLRRELPNALSE